MNRPWVTVRPRTVSHFGVVPTTVDVQVFEPANRFSGDATVGATAWTSGATVFDDKAVTSASVRVWAEPNPPWKPVDEVALPGDTVSRLVPRALISEVTLSWAPCPRPTVRMTAAIPIMMPSTVSVDRSRWVRTASNPVRRISSQLIGLPLPTGRPRPAPRGRSGRLGAGPSARRPPPPRHRG